MARININSVFISGNLTHDPELRYTPSGQAVTNFSIANNRRYRNQAGEWKEETSFLRIVAWARQAEVCNEYLKKGSPVLVEGRLMQRSWQTPEGQKKSTVEIRALRVHFLSAAPKAEMVEEKAVGEKLPKEKEKEEEEEREEEIPF